MHCMLPVSCLLAYKGGLLPQHKQAPKSLLLLCRLQAVPVMFLAWQSVPRCAHPSRRPRLPAATRQHTDFRPFGSCDVHRLADVLLQRA